MNLNKPVFLASSSDEASSQKKILEDKYGKNDFDKADVIVVLGGDGFMLKTIKKFYKLNRAFYGINCGSMGFLLNKYISKVTSEKPRAVAYIDDKAIRFNDWNHCFASLEAAKII